MRPTAYLSTVDGILTSFPLTVSASVFISMKKMAENMREIRRNQPPMTSEAFWRQVELGRLSDLEIRKVVEQGSTGKIVLS